MTTSAHIGVIGGSGLYEIEGLTDIEERRISTPFGEPSDAIILGRLADTPVAFLPRHGRGHRLTPGEVPSRANIYALKSLGVEWVISVSAVGSLREDYAPLDLVIPDQIFDRTKHRPDSFFGGGIVAHVSVRRALLSSFKPAPGAGRERPRECGRASGRHLCLYRGPAVLYQSRVAHLSPARLRRDRHDGCTRGQAGP